jgi:c-di-GMP-binding flagellar brake protein YcgR
VFDQSGTLLLKAGITLVSDQQRDVLFTHFRPCYRDGKDQSGLNGDPAASKEPSQTVTFDEMQLAIGAPLGVRRQIGLGQPMQRSQLIGVGPNRALFATPPAPQEGSAAFSSGENVEVVAVATQGVFWFVCTVEAACAQPSEYLVLSEPGAIRRLRTRKSVRVRTRLAVRYGASTANEPLTGLGIGCDLSILGMSLAAPGVLGRVGEQISVAFHLNTPELDVELQTAAIIRNVQSETKANGLILHGLEFKGISAEKAFALRAFVYTRQDAISYWSSSAG